MNSPVEILSLLIAWSVKKTGYTFKSLFILSLFAGMFIALGAVFFTTITAFSTNQGTFKVIGGICFSLGLILVVLTGAELFTGNNLMIAAVAERKITTADMMKNWLTTYIGNLLGSLIVVMLVYFSQHHLIGDGKVANHMIAIAENKVNLPFFTALSKGVLCNLLVCLAVLISQAAKSVPGKILCILFPITAFVAIGFEHSVANMFFIPMGMMVQGPYMPPITTYQFLFSNLLPVTIGNIIGGTILAGLLYQQAWSKPTGEL